jgi:hypothetical protein
MTTLSDALVMIGGVETEVLRYVYAFGPATLIVGGLLLAAGAAVAGRRRSRRARYRLTPVAA